MCRDDVSCYSLLVIFIFFLFSFVCIFFFFFFFFSKKGGHTNSFAGMGFKRVALRGGGWGGWGLVSDALNNLSLVVSWCIIEGP